MKDILEEIVAHKREEVKARKEIVSPSELYHRTEMLIDQEYSLLQQGYTHHPETGVPLTRFSLKQHLAMSNSGIISEFKRRSPSKGWIFETADSGIIPANYEKAGASALSILTDEMYFGGAQSDILAARPIVNLPILRKDFIIDEYQLFESRLIGANAVLLIAADLTKDQCLHLATRAQMLQMEVLLEVHSEKEIEYINEFIDVVGVNNRNLGTFHTDVQNSFRLSEQLPQDMLRISESGISNPYTVKQLRKCGFRGFLIGENFMKQEDPGKALQKFINDVVS